MLARVPETSRDDVVRAAYTSRADEYTAALGAVEAMDPVDVRTIADWAVGCRGLVVDAGCGPGHWTHLMGSLGVDVEGVDLVPAFVAQARARFPGTRYRVAGLDDLGLADGAAGGVLAWFSTIHHEPARLPAVLRELRRCLADDGTLLLGFFESDVRGPFDHTVTPAWSWPATDLAGVVGAAGFTVRETRTRPNPHRPDRRHGTLLAVRA